jgi:DNA-binding Lrp family transcriptional regulator
MGRKKSIRTELLPMDNGIVESYSPKYVSKLLDSDNVKIISELVRQPEISSLALAKKLDIPLSTLQRRRARIEKALKRNYTFNYKTFGGRVRDLIVSVDRGKSKEVAQNLLRNTKNNVISCFTKINSQHNVSAHVIYKDTEELYELIESIKTMDYVTGVNWSEMVEVIGDNNSEVISAFFCR